MESTEREFWPAAGRPAMLNRTASRILAGALAVGTACIALGASLVFEPASQTLVPIRNGAVAFADFDNDGDLDLVVTGNAIQGATTILYRNDGGKLVPSGIALPGFRSSSVEWGDFDNDGFVDLLLSGISDAGGTRVLRNLGGTNFVVAAVLPAISDGRATWGDYNQDGLLDIAVQGGPLSGQTFGTRVYLNQGGGRFAESALLNSGSYSGTVDWSDYDLDGDLDLLATGVGTSLATSGVFLSENQSGVLAPSTQFIPSGDSLGSWIDSNNDGWPDLIISEWPYQRTRIFTNSHAGQFLQDIQFSYLKTVVPGDFDNDGRLDLMSGVDAYLNPSGTAWQRLPKLLPVSNASVIACGDWDGDGRLDVVVGGDTPELTRLFRNVTAATNQPPEVPRRLKREDYGDAQRLVLEWEPSQDPNQQSGLTYNVRMGTSPGAEDVVSSMSAPNGFRRIVRRGNAEGRTNFVISALSPGKTYYWSVQAVDGAYSGSPFAVEQAFHLYHPPVISDARAPDFKEDEEGEVSIAVQDQDSGPEQIHVTATASPSSLIPPEGISIRRDGSRWTIRLRPALNQNGTATVSLFAADETDRITTTKVTVRVIPVNDRPLVIVPPETTLLEDTAATISLTGFDVDSDLLKYSVTLEPQHGTVFLTGGLATYRPAPNYFGPDSFAVAVSDGLLTSEPAVVRLSISPVVDVPNPVFQVHPTGDGTLEFFVHLDAYQHYRVESSSDLVHWEERLVLQSPTGDLWFYDRADAARRFFRCTAAP